MSNDIVQPKHRTELVAKSHAGFGETIEMRRETAAVAVAERERAAVEARYKMALMRPRSVDEARRRILDHCKRKAFAAAARYALPRAGKKIIGPSIRFVETALAEWGNVLVQCSVVWDDAQERRVEISVTDLERNLCYPKEVVIRKEIERKFLREGQVAIEQRPNSSGEIVYIVKATEADMLTKQGALESKAIRTAGLRILPADIVEEAMEQVATTVRAGAEADPNADRKRLVDAFAEVGVYAKSIEAYLGHPLEQTSPAQREELRVVYRSIKDGDATWADFVEAEGEKQPPVEPESKVAKALVKGRKRRAPKATTNTAPPVNDEEPPPIGAMAPSVSQLADKRATIPEELQEMAGVPAAFPQPTDDERKLDAEIESVRQAIAKNDFSDIDATDRLRRRVRALPGDDRIAMSLAFDEASKGAS